jgi:hypothetical protein
MAFHKMDLEKIHRQYEAHTQKWIDALGNYSDAAFASKPSQEAWSIGQVYAHLASVTEKCLQNALLCANNQGETGHSGFGPAIFSWMGSFPPVKMRIKKIPPGMEAVYAPPQIGKEEALKRLMDALQQMKTSSAAVQKADRKHRVQHWAGGWFNAHQWFHSAEMHLKHHFRQKKRIDQFLGK